MLGELYLEGSKGVEQDMENAIKYLKQAAEKDFEPAISKLYVLGIPYRKMNKNTRNIDDTNHIPASPRYVKPPYADEFNPWKVMGENSVSARDIIITWIIELNKTYKP